MNNKFPSEMQDKFTVRFPNGLRQEIANIAKENNRSMNSEIVYALEQYLKPIDRDSLQRLEILKDLERLFGVNYMDIPHEIAIMDIRSKKTPSDKKLDAIKKIIMEP